MKELNWKSIKEIQKPQYRFILKPLKAQDHYYVKNKEEGTKTETPLK